MALGLAIIYGQIGVINMAHGEFMMIGAYTTYVVQNVCLALLPPAYTDLFFALSLPFAFLTAGGIGLLMELIIIRHLYSRPLESLLATWGISLILIQLARSIFGDLTAVKLPRILSGGYEIAPQIVLPYNRMFIMALAAAIVGGLLGALLAPLWGEITRRKVTRGAGATKDKAAATKDQVVEAVEQQMESMKEKRETDDADQATDH